MMYHTIPNQTIPCAVAQLCANSYSPASGCSPFGFVFSSCFFFEGLRSLDMLTDWSFYGISLRSYGEFHMNYRDNFMELRDASFVFCLIGLLLWIPDMRAYMMRAKEGSTSNDVSDFNRTFPVKMILFVFLLEDLPQLIINGIYLNAVGIESDLIAIISLCFSIGSMVWGILTFMQQMQKHPDALKVGWTTDDNRWHQHVAGACTGIAMVCVCLASTGALTASRSILQTFPWAYTYEAKYKNYGDRGMTESTETYYGLTHAMQSSTASECVTKKGEGDFSFGKCRLCCFIQATRNVPV